jgi:Trypsin
VVIQPAELIIFLGKTQSKGEWTSDGGVNARAVIIYKTIFDIIKLTCFLQVEKISPYEQYAPNSGSNQHDIALIQLRSHVQLSGTISTVCLWSGTADEKFIAGKNGTV